MIQNKSSHSNSDWNVGYSSYKKRERLFTDYYHNQYHKRNHQIVNTTNYQNRLGNKQHNTFRKKKQSACGDLKYSSNLNPFARSKKQVMRIDQPYKDTCQRKKQVAFHSNSSTDPINLLFEKTPKNIRIKPEFVNSTILQQENQKKYYLPAQRQLSGSHRNYQHQLGLSYSLQRLPHSRQKINNSSKMSPIIQYKNVNHSMESLTQKVGSRYY